MRLIILCENSVGRHREALGEHGFACLVEAPSGTFLFDTGQGRTIMHNAGVLGVDLSRLDGIVLSHGHYDHTGGLEAILKAIGPQPVYAHPAIFRERYWMGTHERRSIGLPFARSHLERLGARFELCRTPRTVAPGVWFSGEVPRIDTPEEGDPHLQVPDENGAVGPDPLADDACLVLESSKGPVLLTGCAHAGLIRILRHVRESIGHQRIHAVIGGTHLALAGEAQVAATSTELREFGVDCLGLAHCTGLNRAAQLHAALPGRCSFASVGAAFSF